MAKLGNVKESISSKGHEKNRLPGSSRPNCLSLHVIVKRHLPEDAKDWPQDKIIDELNKIKRVRLDRENIGEIDSLELLSDAVTNLYLQRNDIKCIKNLECLPNLQVLVLSNNKITKIEGILHLQKLIFLDASENCIDTASDDEFPDSIIILNLSGNPCVDTHSHRTTMIKALPKLKQLNNVDISSRDKILAGIACEMSDEDDDEENSEEDDEEKEGDESVADRSNSNMLHSGDLRGMTYKQLPSIQTSITDITTEMLLRSQKRLEESASLHRRHVQEITNIRIKAKIRPNPKISGPK